MHLQYKINVIAHDLADLLEQVFPGQLRGARQADCTGDQSGSCGKEAEYTQSPYDSGKMADFLRYIFPLSPVEESNPDLKDAVCNACGKTDTTGGAGPETGVAGKETGMAVAETVITETGKDITGTAGTGTKTREVDKEANRRLSETRKTVERSGGEEKEPLSRLMEGFGLSEVEENLIILAGITHEHEALSEIFRMLNPYNKPYPTIALAAQLFCRNHGQRTGLRTLLANGPAVQNGIIRLDRDNPLFERNLFLMEKLWPVLGGIDVWPLDVKRTGGTGSKAGLSGWFEEKGTGDAISALIAAGRCYITVTDDEEDIAFQRAYALVERAGLVPEGIAVGPEKCSAELENLISVHATARGVIPVINAHPGESTGVSAGVTFSGFPGPVVIASDSGIMLGEKLRPLIRVQCPTLSLTDTAGMWRKMIPELAPDAGQMAVRYPVEPSMAFQASMDLAHLRKVAKRPTCMEDVDFVMRSRTRNVEVSGIQRVRPKAGWDHLVLREEKKKQLYEARDRLMHQVKVLDEWAFLKDRRGAYGVRMLFSGPSGTGKTLSSEVMANELGLELLIIDLSRVVSKWIGETEKNLARIFRAAEQARAVLLFDEADALFGKRTEVSDAHDRYANLETAYLLARLEQFEGLAILATNLRQNIDTAFMRRLEFVVEFEEPDQQQRVSLWEKHIPDQKLLHGDVNLALLASFYPMVGGMIRNAAVAAAFLAAAEGGPITRKHMIKAIRREYEKSGKSFPGLPPGMTIIKEGYYDNNKSQRVRRRSG